MFAFDMQVIDQVPLIQNNINNISYINKLTHLSHFEGVGHDIKFLIINICCFIVPS